MAEKWWVNPPTGTPVSYGSESSARRAARSVKGAQVSKRKGPTIIEKVLKAFVKDKPAKLPPRDKRR